MFAATVVPGHARYGRVPFGGRGRSARARFGGVHLIARPVAAHGQRLSVVLQLVLVVLVLLLLLMLRGWAAQCCAVTVTNSGQIGFAVVGRRRYRLQRDANRRGRIVAADFRRAYVGWRFAGRPVGLGRGARHRRRCGLLAATGRQALRRGQPSGRRGRGCGRLFGPRHRVHRVRRIGPRVSGTGGRLVTAAAARGRRGVQRRFAVDGRVLYVILQPPEVRGDGEHGRRLGRQERQAARDERPTVPVIVVGPQSAVELVAVVHVVAVHRLVDDGREAVVEHRREHEQAGRQYETCEQT